MKILENNTNYDFNEVIAIENRENNKKRGYLLVNRYQAKHVPVNPKIAREMFQALAREVIKKVNVDKKTTFIGFAETATAIGAVVAETFGKNALYIHTTREEMEEKYNVINFNEEHSHAVNQAVFCSEPEKFFKNSEVIVFVEDEVTTGKTILNFVSAFKEKGYILESQKVIVASILNSMEKENVDKYKDLGIDLVYLGKIVNDFEEEIKNNEVDRSKLHKREEENGKIIYDDNECFDVLEIKGRMETRLGVEMSEYRKACEKLAKDINDNIKNSESEIKKILFLGTEECMYPAIMCGKYFEENNANVKVYTHSTTRSPILPTNVLVKRNELESVYESERKTFVYNLEKYDKVVIVTDVEDINKNGVFTLLEALREDKNNDILLVRWVK